MADPRQRQRLSQAEVQSWWDNLSIDRKKAIEDAYKTKLTDAQRKKYEEQYQNNNFIFWYFVFSHDTATLIATGLVDLLRFTTRESLQAIQAIGDVGSQVVHQVVHAGTAVVHAGWRAVDGDGDAAAEIACAAVIGAVTAGGAYYAGKHAYKAGKNISQGKRTLLVA